jgi:hypothetical protein
VRAPIKPSHKKQKRFLAALEMTKGMPEMTKGMPESPKGRLESVKRKV